MDYKHEGINAGVRENKLRVKTSDVTTESDEVYRGVNERIAMRWAN